MIFKTIEAAIVSLAVGLLLGGYGGYRYASSTYKQKAQENVLRDIVAIRKIDVAAVSNSQTESKVVEAKVATVEARVTEVKKKVKQQNYQVRLDGGITDEDRKVDLAGDRIVLADGTVCLLDTARANRTFNCPAAGSDAASGTTLDVTLEEFVDNDLTVVQKYHALAARHNSLVDYVERLQAEQAKRLRVGPTLP